MTQIKGQMTYHCLDCCVNSIVRVLFQKKPVRCYYCGGGNLQPYMPEGQVVLTPPDTEVAMAIKEDPKVI